MMFAHVCRLLELSTSVGTQIRRYDTKKAASLQWAYQPRQQLQMKVGLQAVWAVLVSMLTS
jgi:hypothetical protein